MSSKDKAIRGVSRNSTEVRFSNRGYAYSETGQSGSEIGIVPLLTQDQVPDIRTVPEGVLIYNLTEHCLQISDKQLNMWRCVSTGMARLGLPSDGNFLDGMVPLSPTGTIVDAIDAINEQLLNCCVGMTFASHLGTTDGSTNGFLIEPNFYIGRVSTSTGLYFTGGWDNDINRDVIKNINLLWQLESGERITDLQDGTITINLLNGQNILIHTDILTLDGTNTDQFSSPNSLVSVTSLQVVGSKVEGYLSINLPLATLLSGNSGYLKVVIIHDVLSSVYSQEIEFFTDSKGTPSITTQTVSLVSAPKKYLSGVGFATVSGTSKPQLEFSLSADDVWDSTYRADLLVVESQQFGISNFIVQYNSSAITKEGISPPVLPIVYNEDFVFRQIKEIEGDDVVSPDLNGNFPQVKYTIRDPFASVNGGFFTPVPHILINTYSNRSNDTNEYFIDENYRLKESSSGVLELTSIAGIGRGSAGWNSHDSLAVVSGLQVINGRLLYPQVDFTSTMPAGNPDYSSIPSIMGDLTYVRRFRSPTGMGYNNGILRIEGLTELDRINKNILIEIRVVGEHVIGNSIQDFGNEGTGWLSLNKDYNYALFNGDDGDGCFVLTGGQSAPNFEFTLGNFSTIFAANQAVEIKVTFKNPGAVGKQIKTIEVLNWL